MNDRQQMNDREQILRDTDPMKLLIKFSIPAILGMVVNALYNVVDRIYIGNIKDVGSMAITGVGITFPIMNIIMGIAMLIGIGAAATISIQLGAGEKEKAEKTLGVSFTLQIILSLIVAVAALIFIDPLLKMFGATPNTFIYAKEYIVVILIGCVANIMSYGLISTIRGEGSPKIASIIILICALTNIILDPIFIFGLGMGVRGAAIATVISQLVGVVLGILYYKSKKSLLKIHVKHMKMDWAIVAPILSIGMAPFLMQVAASGVSIVTNKSLLIYGGDLAIGAMAIINSIVIMCIMPIIGINQGAQPILGYNYGAKLYTRVKKTLLYACGLGTFFSTLGWAFTQFFTKYCVMAFNSDPTLLEISTKGLKIWTFFFIIIGFQIVASNYYQAIGKAGIATVLSLLRQVIILIPATLILSKLMGLDGIWIAGPLSDLLSTLITVGLFVVEIKSLNKLIKEHE